MSTVFHSGYDTSLSRQQSLARTAKRLTIESPRISTPGELASGLKQHCYRAPERLRHAPGHDSAPTPLNGGLAT